MTDKRAIIERAGGELTILIPVDGYPDDSTEFELWVTRELAKSGEPVVKTGRWCVCDLKDLPYRSRMRNAWRMKVDGSGVEIDMTEARKIKTDALRVERDIRLAAEDINYMKADESGDAELKREAVVRKQALRDFPITIQPELEAISDPELLDNFEPTWPK